MFRRWELIVTLSRQARGDGLVDFEVEAGSRDFSGNWRDFKAADRFRTVRGLSVSVKVIASEKLAEFDGHFDCTRYERPSKIFRKLGESRGKNREKLNSLPPLRISSSTLNAASYLRR